MKKEKTKILSEFKSFALRGNVIDLAVGVIIGGAFSGITNSLVNDVMMPILGTFIGGIDFSSLNIVIPPLFSGNEPNLLNIGTFINTIINFIILAFIIFLMIKGINSTKKKEEKAVDLPPAAPPEPSKEEILLTEIRDLLKERREL